MKLLLLGLSLLFACTSCDSSFEKSNTNREGASTPASSKKVDVEVIRDNRIKLEEVSEQQLTPAVSEILGRELTENEQKKLLPMLQLMRSSCSLIWDKKGSLAQGLMLSDCREQSNDMALVRRISLELEANKSVEDIIASLALTGPYFRERDQEQTIEIWFSSEKLFLSEVMARVLELSAKQVNCYIFGEQDHPQLGSSFLLNLTPENRQKLSKWVADRGEIEQFVSVIEPNPSFQASINQNQKAAEQFGVRSSPTWFVNGYRLRGLQSVRQIERFYQYP